MEQAKQFGNTGKRSDHTQIVDRAAFQATDLKRLQKKAYQVSKSIVKRGEEPFRPGDRVDIFSGGEDRATYDWLLFLFARLLEGESAAQMFCSERGRGGKGVIEHMIKGLRGEYNSPVKANSLYRDDRGENEHSAAALDRQGRRILLANEYQTRCINALYQRGF